jgi:hypothetical protein
MNWEMLGAVGEIVGAAGVIATLLYLARQVRSASLDGQRARYNELSTNLSDVAQAWSVNDALASLMLRGFRDPTSLEPEEVFRFYSSVYAAMKSWEASFHYSQEKGVHDWGADGLFATMSSLMALPGFQAYWDNRSSWFSEDFQAEVQRVLEVGAPRMDEAYGD